MRAREQALHEPVDGLPALPLLEALARIHPWILVTEGRRKADGSRRVVWTSPKVSALIEAGGMPPGSDATDFFAMLPHPEQVFPLRATLHSRTHLTGVPIELRNSDGQSLRIDVDLVRIDSDKRKLLLAIGREHPAESGPFDAALLDSIPDAVLALDADGFVRRANPAACRLLGSEEHELATRPVSALLARQSEDLHALASLLDGPPRELERELRLGGAGGETLRVRATLVPLKSGARALRLRDLGAEGAELEGLRSANEELEHALGAIAHDLRSPLVGLLGFSRLLRQDYSDTLDETGRHFVDRIEQGARTMERLLHDLMELARIGASGERSGWVDPQGLLLQLAGELKPRLDLAGIELALPDAGSPAVYCDRARLYQIFANLIGNALQHMGPREGARIEVSILKGSDEVEIIVADNGRGVDPSHRERIFESFQSFGTRAEGGRGTGMGLAIVKRIALKYGGRAWLEGEVASGARFHVTLPQPAE